MTDVVRRTPLQRLKDGWAGLTLARQFLIAGSAVLVAGMLVIGIWVTRQIEARAFSAAGTALGDEFSVANSTQNETQSSATGLTNGNYVIAWTDGSSIIGDISGSHIGASILSGNGTAAGPTHFLVNNTITTGDQTDPAIAGVIDGSFVVAWTTPGGGGLNVEGKSYSTAAVGGSELGFADATGSDQSQVALVAANGQLFFSWTDSSAVSGDGSGTHIGAVDTSSFSVQFLADRAFVNGNQFESSISALADGRFLVVWTDGGLSPGAPDTAPNAVYGQIFDPRLKAVSLVGLGLLNDDWIGSRFNDAMNGAAGSDRINGAAGNDTLVGGLGNDVLTGGAGRDLFVFNTAFKPAANIDTITDYAVADDTIELENALFTKLKKVGVLKDKFFEIGRHAGDGNDYLVYNKKTGVLSYDKDGDGHKHGIAIAQLTDHLQLTGTDFLVI